MRFTHQALYGLGDAQQNFEQLENLAILDRTVVFGTANMPFAGGSGPVTVVVAHGLGRTPQSVDATYIYAGSNGLFVYAQAVDATNITFRGVATAATAGNVAFYWVAIG